MALLWFLRDMKMCFTYEGEDRVLAENVARELYVRYGAELSKTAVARHQKTFSFESVHFFLGDD